MLNLEMIATEIRKDVVRMHQKGTNVASSMSPAEILAALYFHTLRIPSPDDPNRDRFILSKGHAASALYSVLCQKGFFDRSLLATYLADGSALTGHPSRHCVPGIEASTGSLGHGLALAVGLALTLRLDQKPSRVFVLLGDGELQEGSVWEAAALAARLQLDNLIILVDANRLQGYGRVDEIMPIRSFADKWRAFGWGTVEVDGHSIPDLCRTLDALPFTRGQPSAIVAHTVKGKGVAEMEDQLGWHYFSVPKEKVEPFLRELDGGR